MTVTNIDQPSIGDLLDQRAQRRASRRELFRVAGGFALATTAAAFAPHQAAAQAAPTDPDILNFALNLEYLEAEFYSFAVTGAGLPAADRGGSGTQGAVQGGRAVAFTDPVVRQFAREVYADELAHVRFLRGALGTARVAEPAIDVSVGPNSAFSNAARAAGVIGAGETFDPYASDENFLLGSFIFEDVGVTAYKGASPLITNPVFLEAAAGILAVEAYHAAYIRTTLFAKGIAAPALRTNAGRISDARDSLDGASDIDQGITGTADASNIVPSDSNAIAFSRTPGQVLNIVYLNRAAVTAGGFFPAGVNGTIRASAAS